MLSEEQVKEIEVKRKAEGMVSFADIDSLLADWRAMKKVVDAARKLLKECPNIGMECDGQNLELEQALKELE